MLQHGNSRSLLAAGLVGTLVGALLGVLGSQLYRPSIARAVPPREQRSASDDSRRLVALASAVETVAGSIEQLRTEITRSLRPVPPSGTSMNPTRVVEDAPPQGSREAVASSDDRSSGSAELDEMLDSLSMLDGIPEQLDDLQEIQLLIVDLLERVPDAVGFAAASTRLPPIPPETTVRGYLAALKSGDFETAPAHSLWNTRRITERYGSPDEIVNHEEYEEWIYWLDEEEEQFDFHFVNGLCVEAH